MSEKPDSSSKVESTSEPASSKSSQPIEQAEQAEQAAPPEVAVGQGNAGSPAAPVRTGRAVAWLALLLALAATGVSGYLVWLDRFASGSEGAGLDARLESMRVEVGGDVDSIEDRVDEMAARVGRLDRAGQRLSKLEEQLEALRRPDPELAGRVDALADRVGRLEGGQNTAEAGLRARMEEIEARVEQRLEQLQTRLERVGGDLESADRNLTRRLRLIEVESLLALGRDRLELIGDVQAARQAWARASERLSSFPEADFAALKSALDREIDALRNYRPASAGRRVEQLLELAGRIPDLPAPGAEDDGDGDTPDSEPEAGWADRLGSVFRDLVKVESLDGAEPNPVQVDRQRARIQTTLRLAAFAVARAEPQLSARLVTEASETIRRELDADDPRVADALEQLRLLSEPLQIGPPPSLDASQAQLRRLLETSP